MTFSQGLSIFLLGVNVIQFIASFFTRSSMAARMKASYNNWHQVAQTADQITAQPEKAAQRIGVITGFADSERSEIIAYCQTHLGFTPRFEHPSQGGSNPAISSQTVWQRIKAVFRP